MDLNKLGNRKDDVELEGDDSDAGGISNNNFWKLPVYSRSHWMDHLRMELSKEEAEFLKEQIQ